MADEPDDAPFDHPNALDAFISRATVHRIVAHVANRNDPRPLYVVGARGTGRSRMLELAADALRATRTVVTVRSRADLERYHAIPADDSGAVVMIDSDLESFVEPFARRADIDRSVRWVLSPPWRLAQRMAATVPGFAAPSERIDVTPLTPAQVHETLQRVTSPHGRVFNRAAAHSIHAATLGFPDVTVQLARASWINARGSEIDEVDVAYAAHTLEPWLRPLLAERVPGVIGLLPATHRDALRTLAAQPPGAHSAAALSTDNTRAPRYLDELARIGLVQKVGDRYTLAPNQTLRSDLAPRPQRGPERPLR